MPWTAGWNMPGYLPEADPATFDTWHEAHAYIVGEVDRAWDEAEDEGTFLDAHTSLHVVTTDQPYTVIAGDYAYWVVAAEDVETCSWCTAEVPDSTLREQPDGARICQECRTVASGR